MLLPAEQAPAAHHRKIIKALEGVTRGETRRLIILMPPGSAKSTYTSRIFPAWWLSRHPASAVIAASHTASLAENFGRSVRGIIAEKGAPLGLVLCPDQRAAGDFRVASGGEYFAIGVRGAVTGRRADLAVIDDPIASIGEAESYASREHLWEWFRSELVTRLKPKGRIVLVMTRWHCDDLAGRLLQRDDWQVLRLPALAEPGDPMGREPGAALWPEWEDSPALLEKKALLGERHFSALFQQNPLGETGQLFDTRALRVVDSVPPGETVRAWDLAASLSSDGNPDWTVGLRMTRDARDMYFIDDIVRFRALPAEVTERIVAEARNDGRGVVVCLPQDPGQAGKSQIYYLVKQLAGFRVITSTENGHKTTRAFPAASQMAQGNFSMRRAHWNAAFLDELATFPLGQKDDQVDALSRAFLMLSERPVSAKFSHVPLLGR